MASVKKLLNKISDFRCKIDDAEIVFPGVLQEEKKQYYSERKVSYGTISKSLH